MATTEGDRWHWLAREAVEGLAAAGAALLAMAGVATAGLLLLDADRIGSLATLAAAVVALAMGGSAEFSATPGGSPALPFGLQGGLDVMPLGISLVGAVVLGTLLVRRGKDGLLVRGAAATVAFVAGLALTSRLARGTLAFQLPDDASGRAHGLGAVADCAKGWFPGKTGRPFGGLEGLGAIGGLNWLGGISGSGRGLSLGTFEAKFLVAPLPVSTAAGAWALVVVGVCWSATRFQVVSAGLRAVLWPLGVIAIASLLAAGALGGAAAAGAVLLMLPAAVFGTLLLGLGVPWTVSSEGPLSCALDSAGTLSPGGSLVWVSGAALLGYGIVVAVRTRGGAQGGGPLRRAATVAVRLGPVVGALLAVMALLARASVNLEATAFGFSVPILDARLAASPLVALVTGLAAGAGAGFAASLLVDGLGSRISVSWRPWNDRVRR